MPVPRSHHLERLCRKALRLGKFLGNVEAGLELWAAHKVSPLDVIATTGEGLYYFLDQFVWCAPQS